MAGFAAVLFIAALPAGAAAQTDDTDARALSLYRAGETAFHAGEYEAA